MVKNHLPGLIEKHAADLCILNGENAAGGFGISEENVEEFFSAGADVITTGNHIWNRREASELLSREVRLLRPANYPDGTPGRGLFVAETASGPVAVVNLMGRVFMPPVNCPFREADHILEALAPEVRIVFIDLHAEATSEKVAMGWYLDGRVSALIGTHTHVQTADERVLPKGCAYLSDAGMTGPADSVIGIKAQLALKRFLSGVPHRFEVATGPAQFNGAVMEVDETSGRALSIERIAFREESAEESAS